MSKKSQQNVIKTVIHKKTYLPTHLFRVASKLNPAWQGQE